jgi:hypothetical protein
MIDAISIFLIWLDLHKSNVVIDFYTLSILESLVLFEVGP